MTPEVAFWLVVSALGLAFSVVALREVDRDAQAARNLNGSILGITVRGALFQERLRFLIQVLFVVVGILAATDVATELITPLLLATPVILAVNSLRRMQDRRRIAHSTESDILAERDLRMHRLEDQGDLLEKKLDENTRITQEASDNADAAFVAANSVNEKIATQGATIIQQGVHAAADRVVNVDTNATAHRIDERTP